VRKVLFAPVEAKLVKIVQDGSHPGNFWSVHEIYIFE